MSAIQADTTVLSNELLDEDIPCMHCGSPAKLRSFGHDRNCLSSTMRRPPVHVCLSCWQVWAARITKKIVTNGYVRCWTCDRRFDSLASFSDYREF